MLYYDVTRIEYDPEFYKSETNQRIRIILSLVFFIFDKKYVELIFKIWKIILTDVKQPFNLCKLSVKFFTFTIDIYVDLN